MISTIATGGNTAFVATAFALNPGSAATFPWLSTQAPSWEMYRFHRLKFEYVSRCTTTSLGVVTLGCDYDAADAPPQSEQILSTYSGTISNNCWVPNFSIDLVPSRLHPAGPKYVRIDTLAANQDIKTYDAGNFYACTSDGPIPVSPLGKLWVEYEIEFSIPSLPPTGALSQGSLHSTASVAGITRTSIYGTSPTTLTNGNINVTFGTVTNVITFNTIGQFLVTFYQTGTVMFGGGPVLFTASTANVVGSDLQMTPVGALTCVFTARVIVTSIGQTLVPICTVHTTVFANVVTITDYNASLGSLIV